jgi:tRNA_anti-like
MPRRDDDRFDDEDDVSSKRPRKSGGSFPVWAIVLLCLIPIGLVVVVGGGLALFWARGSAKVQRAEAQANASAVMAADVAKEDLGPPINVGGAQLIFNAYDDNPIKAESKYLGKHVEVLGFATVEKDARGHYAGLDTVAYGFGKRPAPGLVAYIDKGEEQKFADIQPGTAIVITGVVRRFRQNSPGAYKGIVIEMDRAKFVRIHKDKN